MPLPYGLDKESLKKILQFHLPTTEDDQQQLKKTMGIKYRHVTGHGRGTFPYG